MGLITKLNEGGIFMYFIMIFGFLSFGLIVERYLNLYRNIQEPAKNFRNQFLNFIAQGDLTHAKQYADSSTNVAIGRIAKMGIALRTQGAGDEELQARMDECLTAEIAHIDRRTGFLGMFGNVATLLGLLGTITGMIHSFAAVASANPSDRATLLSKGISEAMNCTAFGLIVAIPALVAFAVYQNKTDQLVNKLTSMTSEIFHDLLFFTDKKAGVASSVRMKHAVSHTSPTIENTLN